MGRLIDRQIGEVFGVKQALYQAIVVKRELSKKATFSI